MSKTSSASKIKLNSYDSLFGMNDAMTEAGNVRLVKLSEGNHDPGSHETKYRGGCAWEV